MNIRKFNKGEAFWSVKNKQTRRVIHHEFDLLLKDCWFTVQQGGQSKVRQLNRKNVHAWVNGQLVWSGGFPTWLDLTRVRYNPYDTDFFEVDPHGKAIAASQYVYFRSNGTIYSAGKIVYRAGR